MSARDEHAPPPQRRGSGGSRRQSSNRVILRSGPFETTGWALNVSRGGMRLVVEDPVEQGAEYELSVSDQGETRRARVVWVQQRVDGQIIGVEFVAEGEVGV
ncbi:MAG TPA: PilZ domain-containing protein [Polyangiaceae bacterium]